MSNEKVYLLSEANLLVIRLCLEKMWAEVEEHTYTYNEAEDNIHSLLDQLEEADTCNR